MSNNHFSHEIERMYDDMEEGEKMEILEKQQSIQLYKDLMVNSMKDLNFTERGVLISLILSQYLKESFNDGETGKTPFESATRMINMAYRIIGENIKTDNERYIKTVIKNKINGGKGGRPKKE